MAFTVSTYAGAQPIANKETTQKHPLGTIVRGHDPTYGEGEFIYLKGAASTIAGSVVEYSTSFQTGLDSSALDTPKPLAVAMTTTTASYYGWYQISGIAQVAKLSTTSFAADAYFAASAGLAIAAASGLRIHGAQVAVVASAVSVTAPDLVTAMINRPSDPGG
jgi:predicted RecA/RadA family phage recombinase